MHVEENSDSNRSVSGSSSISTKNNKKTTITVFKVGGKTTLGAGLGILTGIFGAIAAASVFEVVVPALLITKVAGVVGGAAGLIKGVRDAEKQQ